MERRIAVIVPGGVQEGQHIPAIVGLLSRLSRFNTIHLYSFSDGPIHPLLDCPEIIRELAPKLLRWSKLLSMKYFFFKILADHRRHVFSLLHCFWINPAGITGLFTNLLAKIPFLLSLPGGDIVYLKSINYGGMRSPFHRAFIRWCCRMADRVTILSRYQESIMKMNRVYPRRSAIIPFGVDANAFSYRPKEFSIPLRMISIGNINGVKDIFVQIDTLAILRRKIDSRLTIVGPDHLKGELREYARDLRVEQFIDWTGERPHSDVPSILQSSHLLLHTAWYEAQAMVVMEAFTAGTLVVGTRVGMLSDMDINEECTVVEHDATLLAEKILHLIEHPPKIQSIRERNRKYAEEHSIEWTALQYQKLYEEMIREGRS